MTSGGSKIRGKVRLLLWCVSICVIVGGAALYSAARFGYGEPYRVIRPDSSEFMARPKTVEWLPGPTFLTSPSTRSSGPRMNFDAFHAVGETMCESTEDAIQLAKASGPPWSLWDLQAQRNGRFFEVSFRNGRTERLRIPVGTNHYRRVWGYPTVRRGCYRAAPVEEPEMITITP